MHAILVLGTGGFAEKEDAYPSLQNFTGSLEG